MPATPLEAGGQTGMSLVLKGEEIKKLPASRKAQLGQQVSEVLGEHRATMLQYDAQQVVGIIDELRAVVVTDPASSEVHAFAQVSPWMQDGIVAATELRSWLSKKPGAGLKVLHGAVALNQQQYPGITLYAVAEEGNVRAHAVLLKAGAEEVQMPDSMKVVLKAGEEPAPVKTFSLANISATPEHIATPSAKE